MKRNQKDGYQFAEESIHIPGVCQWKEKEQPFPHQILCPSLHLHLPHKHTICFHIAAP